MISLTYTSISLSFFSKNFHIARVGYQKTFKCRSLCNHKIDIILIPLISNHTPLCTSITSHPSYSSSFSVASSCMWSSCWPVVSLCLCHCCFVAAASTEHASSAASFPIPPTNQQTSSSSIAIVSRVLLDSQAPGELAARYTFNRSRSFSDIIIIISRSICSSIPSVVV